MKRESESESESERRHVCTVPPLVHLAPTLAVLALGCSTDSTRGVATGHDGETGRPTVDAATQMSDAAAPRPRDATRNSAVDGAAASSNIPDPSTTGNTGAALPDASTKPAPSSPPDPEVCLHELAGQGETRASCDDHFACRNGYAYTCVEDDVSGDRCWKYAPDVSCPLWDEEQCEVALESFGDQPCSSEDDCAIWGGLEAEGACEVSAGPPAISISSLLPRAERDELRSAYDDLLAHGCVEDWGYDGTPHFAVCAQGQCQAWQDSCLREPSIPDDAGLDASAYDASAASTANLDAAR